MNYIIVFIRFAGEELLRNAKIPLCRLCCFVASGYFCEICISGCPAITISALCHLQNGLLNGTDEVDRQFRQIRNLLRALAFP